MALRFVRPGLLVATLALAGCGADHPPRSPRTATSSPATPVEATPVAPPVVYVGQPPPPPSVSAPDQPTGGPGWIGVDLSAPPLGETGVVIRGVVPGSPAAGAGLAEGDQIFSVDGQNVAQPSDVVTLVGAHPAGGQVSLGVHRGGRQRLFAVRLAPKPDHDHIMQMTYVGQHAPTLDGLKAAQGSVTPTLGALQGKVVVLEFWAPWCIVCRVLAPTMDSWQKRYAGQGVVVLGVTNEPVDRAALAATQLGMTYPVAADESGRTFRAYRALALPTLFVIDKQGTVRDVIVGYSSDRMQQTQALLDRLVAEP